MCCRAISATSTPVVAPLRALASRLRVPAEHAALAEHVCRFHLDIHRAFELSARDVARRFSNASMHSARPERIAPFLLACEADKRGRLGLEEAPYPQADYVRAAYAAAAAVDAAAFVEQGLTGPAIGEAVRKARVQAIAKVRSDDPELLRSRTIAIP